MTATRPSTRRILSRASGFSLLELAVALAITGLLLALVVPRLSSRTVHFTGAVREFTANVEVARALARSRTTRYRVRIASTTSYVIEPGTPSQAGWLFLTTERTLTLPSGVVFSAGSVGQTATFDSRSRLVGVEVAFTLLDNARGWSRQILVRVTGMVEAP